MTDPASADPQSTSLPFTGERFTPECVREIWYEHWHRYAFALPLAKGRRVLDAACGEGYGSALLAGVAESVLGVDLSREAIDHAQQRYADRANLRFLQADVTRLDELPDASFDLIVSLETLEHVQAQEPLLDGFRRLLAPDGVLLVSTPDKTQYNAHGGEPNPFHLRELERDEFEALLSSRFAHRRLFAQKLLFVSALWSLDRPDGRWQADTERDGRIEPGLGYPPLYYVAACAQHAAPLAGLAGLSLFGDAREQVYRHYDEEIRRHIAAGHRLAELEAELTRLRAELAAQRNGDE